MPKVVRKCQNRKGKKCIPFNGKNVYYTNGRNAEKELAKKLNIPLGQAKTLLKDDGRRIAIGPGGNTLAINIKNENFRAALQRDFGIKRIDNKRVINNGHVANKNVDIMKVLGPNAQGKYILKITLYISFPSPNPISKDEVLTNGKIDMDKINGFLDLHHIEERTINDVYNGLNSGIDAYVKSKVDEYMYRLRNTGAELIHYIPRLGDSFRNRKLHYNKGYVREFEDALELTEWANIEYRSCNRKDSCVADLIGDRFPDLYWEIKKLEVSHNGTPAVLFCDFTYFCRAHCINYKIYGETGKLIESDTSLASIGAITCFIYNNHIYPVNGGKPKRHSIKEYIIKHIDDSAKKLEDYLSKDKKLPSRINIDAVQRKSKLDNIGSINITSFVVKDKRYICNKEYEKCLDVLTKMGYEKHIYDGIRVTDIPRLIESIIKPVDKVSSFIPEKDMFKTSPLLWKTNRKIRRKLVRTVDKNKCYSYALYSLPYLLKFDYRKNKINKNPTMIKDTYLYVAKPKKWSILLPKTKIYPGYFLSECKELGFEFELLEELEAEMRPNYFRQIMDKMCKVMDPTDFKNAWNFYIGTFERSDSKSYVYEYAGIFTDEAADTQEGFVKKIGDYNLMFNEKEKHLHVRDRLPLATQIKDQSRMMIFKKIKELGLSIDDIVQINTDSISYYGELPTGLDPTIFSGWKSSEFKELGEIAEGFDDELSVLNIENSNDNIRYLHTKYAGAGKTTYVVNELVPRLRKEGKSFVVLAPTRRTWYEYVKAGVNCEIMQKFVFAKTIPKEDYIIIDEIGFVDSACHDVLYNINRANKSFECFGDFNQLQPVKEDRPLNQPHYLKYMFNKFDSNFINYRNNFTTKYYDSLINSNDKIHLENEINKWATTDMMKADYILCYRIKTKKKYNDIMLEKLGFTQWNDVGVRIICTSNYFLQNKICDIYTEEAIDICNNMELTIVDIVKDDDYVFVYTLEDETGAKFHIREKHLLSKFEPAYAINVHQAQGMSLNSYYWVNGKDNRFLNGNVAYVIISRLIQKLNFNLEREIQKAIDAGIFHQEVTFKDIKEYRAKNIPTVKRKDNDIVDIKIDNVSDKCRFYDDIDNEDNEIKPFLKHMSAAKLDWSQWMKFLGVLYRGSERCVGRNHVCNTCNCDWTQRHVCGKCYYCYLHSSLVEYNGKEKIEIIYEK